MENSGDGGKEDNQNSIGAKRWGREGKEVTDPKRIRSGKDKKDMKLFPSTLLVHEEKEVDTNTNPGVLGWSSSFFPASVLVSPPFLVGLLDGLIICP